MPGAPGSDVGAENPSLCRAMADLLPQLSGRRLHRSAAGAAVHKRPAMHVSVLRHHVVHIVQTVPRPLCWRVRGTGRCQPPWFCFGIHDTCQVCRALSRITADVDVAGVLLIMAQCMPFIPMFGGKALGTTPNCVGAYVCRPGAMQRGV